MKPLLAALLFVFLGLPAFSRDLTTSQWSCGTKDALFDLQVSRNGVRVNNFSLKERQSFMTKSATVLEATYSIANRSDKKVFVNAQIAGFDSAEKLVFALAVKPSFDIADAGKTEDASGNIFIEPKELETVRTFCVRLTGEF